MRTIGLILSVIFLILSAGGFFWLWQSSETIPISGMVGEQYQTVEIESVKSEAAQILKPVEKDNLSGMPIKAPDSSKVGKANPFL